MMVPFPLLCSNKCFTFKFKQSRNSLSKPERWNQVFYTASLCSWCHWGLRCCCSLAHHHTKNIFASPSQSRQTMLFCWPDLPWTSVCRSKLEKGTPNVFSFCPLHGCRLCHQTQVWHRNLSLGAHRLAEQTSHASPFAQYKNLTGILPLQAQGFIFPEAPIQALGTAAAPKASKGCRMWCNHAQTSCQYCKAWSPVPVMYKGDCACRNTVRCCKSRGFGDFIWTRRSLWIGWWLSSLSSTASNKLHVAPLKA